MISWIQNHLIRHGRWIFLTLLAVIIIAFVFTIGNTPGCTSKQSGYTKQLFYGYDLNSSHEMSELSKKVSLSAILRSGRPIQNEQQFQAQLTGRIALLHLANEIGVPPPEQKAIAEYIQSMAAFRGPDGQFSRDAYTRFIDNIESNPNIQQELIVVVLEEDYRIDQVRKVLQGPGYFLPSEASSQVLRNETDLTFLTAEISYNEFEPELVLNDSELNAYYLDNIQRYEIPERIQAGYISFFFDDYANSVEDPAEVDLQQHFNANRAKFTAEYKASQQASDQESDESTESSAVAFEDVRNIVAADFIKQQASRLAHKAAQDFALTLYHNNIQRDSEAFQKILQNNNLTLTEIFPFTKKDAAESFLPKEMLESAFTLNERRYFSDVYTMKDRYCVLIYKGRALSEVPSFESVAPAVRADYVADKKKLLFSEEGSRLGAELEKSMQTEAFVPAAEALNLQVTEYGPFKVIEAPRSINRAVLQKAQNMQPGELSPMLTIEDKGVFVYLKEKTVPDVMKDDEKLSQAKEFLRQYSSFTSYNSILNELVASGLNEKDD